MHEKVCTWWHGLPLFEGANKFLLIDNNAAFIFLVPPSAPVISVIGTTTNSVSLQWKVDDIGGAPLRGFTLTYRKEFGDWEEIQLDRRVNSHLLEGLQCGTRYQFTLVTFNKIGTSATSSIEVGKTKGISTVRNWRRIQTLSLIFCTGTCRKQTRCPHQT